MPMSSQYIAPTSEGRAAELDALLSDVKSSTAVDPARIESCA